MSSQGQIRVYNPSSSAVFLKTREEYGGLSNMAAGYSIEVNGLIVKTSEALYQACRYPHLPDVQNIILREHSPMTAKMRSKSFLEQSRPDWDLVRVPIMRWSLRAKLAQNWEKFGSLLLSTGDMPIVEMKTRKIDFWGAKVKEDGSLVGMNVLGRLLMELREKLKSNSTDELRTVRPLNIENFMLFGEAIGPIEGSRQIRQADMQFN